MFYKYVIVLKKKLIDNVNDKINQKKIQVVNSEWRKKRILNGEIAKRWNINDNKYYYIIYKKDKISDNYNIFIWLFNFVHCFKKEAI